MTWEERYEAGETLGALLDEFSAKITAAVALLKPTIYVHVPGTAFMRECRVCGRKSYSDGRSYAGKPIHVDGCEALRLIETLEAQS